MRLKGKTVSFQDSIFTIEASKSIFLGEKTIDDRTVRVVTFQLTERCNLACTYCYQVAKTPRVLEFETAKRFIDLLIEESYKEDSMVSIYNTNGIILEFIGGEPLLEVELMDKITDYFRKVLIEKKHDWLLNFRISMISNGVLYFNPDFQKYLQKNKSIMSFSISLDGCKELHDKCRLFHNGEGSYDIVEKACLHHLKHYDNDMTTKMTFAPENIEYAYEAILNLIKLGYKTIYCNPVYENVWKPEHTKVYYEQLKKIADYLIDNKLYEDIEISAFDNNHFNKIDLSTDDKNYCGSTGSMISLDCDGYIYPCIRFMKSSLGDKVEPFTIGHIDTGIGKLPNHKKHINILDTITLTSQSTDECINCNISGGCGWCTAYNYQETGSANKRVVSICGLHKARALANVYYWNSIYKKEGVSDVFKINIKEEDVINIVGEAESKMIMELINR